MTNEEFLEHLRKEMRDLVQNAVTLMAANANRSPSFADRTPPPISAEDLKRSEEKASNTAKVLAFRDNQIVTAMQGMETRSMERMSNLEQQIWNLARQVSPATAAVNDAATSATSAASAAQDVASKQSTTNRALIVAIVVPTLIGVAGILINRFAPPAREEKDKAPPVLIYQAPPIAVPQPSPLPSSLAPAAGGSAR